MKKRTRILLGIAISVFLILHEFWINWLFPGVSLVAMFVIPFLIVFSLGAGVAAYFILELTKSRAITALVTVAIVIPVMFFQLWMHPTDVSPFTQTSRYWTTFWKYPDDIQYEDLAFGSTTETVAAMVKYQDNLPDRIVPIRIVDYRGEEPVTLERYYFSYRDGNIEYDAKKLKVTDAGEKTLLVVNHYGSDRKEYYLDTSLTYLLEGSWGWGASEPEDGLRIAYTVEDFEADWTLHTGAAQLFTLVLRLLR